MITNIDQPLLGDAIMIKSEFLNYKQNYSQENKKYKHIVKELIDMGFELDMIDMCFCFYNVRSIEQAISYLTKEEGVWQHNYIESENKLCIVCKEHSDHLNYKVSLNNPKQVERESLNNLLKDHSFLTRNSLSPDSNTLRSDESHVSLNFNREINTIRDQDNSKNASKNLEAEKCDENNISIHNLGNHILCKVCEMEYPKDETSQLKCGHIFCNECWFYYLEQKISYSEVLEINCMSRGCTYSLSDENIKRLLMNNLELYEKYHKFKNNKLILNDADKKFCPEVNCLGFLEKTSEENFISCQFGHEYCYNCLSKWHNNKRCEEIIDEDFEKWKKGKYIKQCPNCQFWTEKNEGCNHMTCKACNYDWCWYCTRQCRADHYTRWGTCYGLQFGNNTLYHYSFCRFLRGFMNLIGYFFIFIGIILAFLLFGSSILAVLYAGKIVKYNLNDCQKIFIYGIVAICAAVFQPLYLVFVISVIGIFLGLSIICSPIIFFYYQRVYR